MNSKKDIKYQIQKRVIEIIRGKPYEGVWFDYGWKQTLKEAITSWNYYSKNKKNYCDPTSSCEFQILKVVTTINITKIK